MSFLANAVGPILGSVVGGLFGGHGGGGGGGGGAQPQGNGLAGVNPLTDLISQLGPAAAMALVANTNKGLASDLQNNAVGILGGQTNNAVNSFKSDIAGLQNPGMGATAPQLNPGAFLAVNPQTISQVYGNGAGQLPTISGGYQSPLAGAYSAQGITPGTLPNPTGSLMPHGAPPVQSAPAAAPAPSGPSLPAGYNWQADPSGGWYRAPYGAKDQLSYNPSTGQYDFSNPYAGVGDMANNLGHGQAPTSLQGAIDLFRSVYGNQFTPNGGASRQTLGAAY